MSPSSNNSTSNAKNEARSQGHKDEDIEGDHNDWKFRVPYKVHENDEDFKVLERPLSAKFCHCTTCQVLHGAPFQWAAIFHKEDINFTHGHHDLGWYESEEKTTRHKLPCKVSCAYCRTPIMDEGRNMILLFPSLIKFKSQEEKEKFNPTCHMFYSRRLVDIPDGLPKWTGLNDKSDLIEDSPPEAIQKRKREKEEEEKDGKGENGHEKKKERKE
ncbi:hypothetical protein H4I96_03308 [Botrytis cinerea]